MTGPSSTLIPLPLNSFPIARALSSIKFRSKDAAAVKAEGNWVTKSVCRGPEAATQSLPPISIRSNCLRPSLKQRPGMPSLGTPPEFA